MEKTLTTYGGQERRQYKRFGCQDDAIVFLGKDTGSILNISKGGLAVKVNVSNNDSIIPSRLDIFFAEPRFYLPNLPVRLISEKQMLSSSVSYLLQSKRLCMEFGPLASDQEALLDDFISRNALLAS